MKQTFRQLLIQTVDAYRVIARRACGRLHEILSANVYFGKNIDRLPMRAIVFFPLQVNTFYCGIAAIVSYKSKKSKIPPPDTAGLEDLFARIEQSGWESCNKANGMAFQRELKS